MRFEKHRGKIWLDVIDLRYSFPVEVTFTDGSKNNNIVSSGTQEEQRMSLSVRVSD